MDKIFEKDFKNIEEINEILGRANKSTNLKEICTLLGKISNNFKNLSWKNDEKDLIRNVHGLRNPYIQNKYNEKGAKIDFEILVHLDGVKAYFFQDNKLNQLNDDNLIKNVKGSILILIKKIKLVIDDFNGSKKQTNNQDLGFLLSICSYINDQKSIKSILFEFDSLKNNIGAINLDQKDSRYFLGSFLIKIGEISKKFSDIILNNNPEIKKLFSYLYSYRIIVAKTNCLSDTNDKRLNHIHFFLELKINDLICILQKIEGKIKFDCLIEPFYTFDFEISNELDDVSFYLCLGSVYLEEEHEKLSLSLTEEEKVKKEIESRNYFKINNVFSEKDLKKNQEDNCTLLKDVEVFDMAKKDLEKSYQNIDKWVQNSFLNSIIRILNEFEKRIEPYLSKLNLSKYPCLNGLLDFIKNHTIIQKDNDSKPQVKKLNIKLEFNDTDIKFLQDFFNTAKEFKNGIDLKNEILTIQKEWLDEKERKKELLEKYSSKFKFVKVNRENLLLIHSELEYFCSLYDKFDDFSDINTRIINTSFVITGEYLKNFYLLIEKGNFKEFNLRNHSIWIDDWKKAKKFRDDMIHNKKLDLKTKKEYKEFYDRIKNITKGWEKDFGFLIFKLGLNSSARFGTDDLRLYNDPDLLEKKYESLFSIYKNMLVLNRNFNSLGVKEIYEKIKNDLNTIEDEHIDFKFNIIWQLSLAEKNLNNYEKVVECLLIILRDLDKIKDEKQQIYLECCYKFDLSIAYIELSQFMKAWETADKVEQISKKVFDFSSWFIMSLPTKAKSNYELGFRDLSVKSNELSLFKYLNSVYTLSLPPILVIRTKCEITYEIATFYIHNFEIGKSESFLNYLNMLIKENEYILKNALGQQIVTYLSMESILMLKINILKCLFYEKKQSENYKNFYSICLDSIEDYYKFQNFDYTFNFDILFFKVYKKIDLNFKENNILDKFNFDSITLDKLNNNILVAYRDILINFYLSRIRFNNFETVLPILNYHINGLKKFCQFYIIFICKKKITPDKNNLSLETAIELYYLFDILIKYHLENPIKSKTINDEIHSKLEYDFKLVSNNLKAFIKGYECKKIDIRDFFNISYKNSLEKEIDKLNDQRKENILSYDRNLIDLHVNFRESLEKMDFFISDNKKFLLISKK
ncbi:unnamed protein product [Brachionus calyciflorus]|uniref:Uncharacterized protein n=1 Tax=Brachionus calyciflorus TaxID=104777 RepID=A0A814AGW1_9BILA|nr:unnamed protein product [Brachionus calyciflorus]